ncbi:MAG: hypothetical protein V1859_08085 [archaeon]
MKKYLSVVIIALIVAVSAAYASCNDISYCKNQDNDFFCGEGDTSCTYVKYTGSEDNCAVDETFTDSDSDADLWSDNCDAFVDDNTEWLDFDGDSCGNNKDINDYDYSEVSGCKESESDESGGIIVTTVDKASGSGSSGRGICMEGAWKCTVWSECLEGKTTRICTKVKDCDGDWNKPSETSVCDKPKQVVETQETNEDDSNQNNANSNENNDASSHNEAQNDVNGITGLVIGNGANTVFSPWFLVPFVMASLVLVFLFAISKRKKKEHRATVSF